MFSLGLLRFTQMHTTHAHTHTHVHARPHTHTHTNIHTLLEGKTLILHLMFFYEHTHAPAHAGPQAQV